MARPWRIQFPDAIYHVTARGNRRADIFQDDLDRRDFLQLLGQASERYGLHFFAFCLMSNHYHLFLRTPQANLSQAMHWLNVTYTVRFNRRQRTEGHLFQGRFKAILITDESHWQHLSFYLHLNPVRAGLVRDPADYVWSSFREYTRRQSRFPWLQPGEILESYGGTPSAQRRYYRQVCLSLSAERSAIWDPFRGNRPTGSRENLARLAEKHRPRGNPKTVPQYQRARLRQELSEALQRVAESLGVAGTDFPKRRANDPLRSMAYWYLASHQGYPVTEVGRALGVGVSAVSMGVKRLEQRMRHDQALAKRLRDLCEM
jgi:REP element-mobilizing transposase RayT